MLFSVFDKVIMALYISILFSTCACCLAEARLPADRVTRPPPTTPARAAPSPEVWLLSIKNGMGGINNAYSILLVKNIEEEGSRPKEE